MEQDEQNRTIASGPNPDHVMFARDVADMLGITVKALRRRVDDGRHTVPPVHRGPVRGHAHRMYWLRPEVEAWLRGMRWPG